MRLSLTISTAGHAAALGALLLLVRALPAPLVVAPPKSFEIALSAPAAQIETISPVAPAEPVLKPVQPEPDRRVAVAEPPPPKPAVRPPARPKIAGAPPPHPVPPLEPTEEAPAPQVPPPAPAPAAYTPPPRPDLEAGYKASLGRWFESHKRYPDSAREHAEQGSAVVRFRVDPSGRVLSFSLAQSTGYPDLDRAVEAMLDGAQLPPFPAGLTLSSLDVAVTLRFSLTR
jgi:protein TonB